MRTDKTQFAINLFKQMLNDTYGGWGKICHATHEQMLQRVKELLYLDGAYAKLPRWAKNYLRGYQDALLHKLYDEMEFRIFYNGEWINPKLIKNMEQKLVDRDKGGHFWKGTDKMWAGHE